MAFTCCPCMSLQKGAKAVAIFDIILGAIVVTLAIIAIVRVAQLEVDDDTKIADSLWKNDGVIKDVSEPETTPGHKITIRSTDMKKKKKEKQKGSTTKIKVKVKVGDGGADQNMESERDLEAEAEKQKAHERFVKKAILLGIHSIPAVFLFVQILLAIFLFIAAGNRNHQHVKIWAIVSIIFFIFTLACLALLIVYKQGEVPIGITVAHMIYKLYGIAVILNFVKELKSDEDNYEYDES